ncbi:MAG: two-CW domain-containing protein [Bacteroidota bacterium]
MGRKNCWEVLKCGREQGGEKAEELGVCPVCFTNDFDGLNNGINGGRICWMIAGTYCNGNVTGTFAHKLMDCLSCEFLIQVNDEEGWEFKLIPENFIKKNDHEKLK